MLIKSDLIAFARYSINLLFLLLTYLLLFYNPDSHDTQVEVKHGRIAMLAVLGHITTTSGIHFGGEIAYGTPFSSVANGLAGLFGPHAVPQQGLVQLIIFIGALDLGFTNYAKPEVEAYCAGKAAAAGWSEGKLNSKKAIELNNGKSKTAVFTLYSCGLQPLCL